MMLCFYLYLLGRIKGHFGRGFWVWGFFFWCFVGLFFLCMCVCALCFLWVGFWGFFKFFFKRWKILDLLDITWYLAKMIHFSKAGRLFLFLMSLRCPPPPESRTHKLHTYPTRSFTLGSFAWHFMFITKYYFTACDFGLIASRLDWGYDCKRTREHGGRKPSHKDGFPLY